MSKECAECGAISDDTYDRCPICAADLPRTVVSETRIKMDRRRVFLTGLNQIRFGVLGLIIQLALYFALSPISYDLLAKGFSQLYSNGTYNGPLIESIFYNLRIVIVGMLAVAVVVAVTLRAGFSNLSIVNNTYSIGKTGSLIEIFGLGLSMVGSFLLFSSLAIYGGASFSATSFSSVFSNIEISLIFLIPGALLGLVGLVMAATALVRLGVQFGNSVVRTGGIFYFIFGALGAVLLYFGITAIIKKVSRARRYAKAPKKMGFP